MDFLKLLVLHLVEIAVIWYILERRGSSRSWALAFFLVTMQMAIWVRFVTAGWLIFLFIPVLLVHLALSIVVLINRPEKTAGVAAAAFAFLLACLFVRDLGDGPDWIPIAVLVHGTEMGAAGQIPLWASNPLLLLLILVAVPFSWGWMIFRALPEKR